MSVENNYESRLLYSQEAFVDETVRVKSNVYAVSYNFTNAITSITARCRLTMVYSENSDMTIEPKGGTIEKWSDQGWHIIDEYFDSFIAFDTVDEGLEFMAAMFKSFLLGAPMKLVPTTRTPPTPSPIKPDKIPEVRVISFAKEKAKSEKSESKKNKKTESDSPDFDWI